MTQAAGALGETAGAIGGIDLNDILNGQKGTASSTSDGHECGGDYGDHGHSCPTDDDFFSYSSGGFDDGYGGDGGGGGDPYRGGVKAALAVAALADLLVIHYRPG